MNLFELCQGDKYALSYLVGPIFRMQSPLQLGINQLPFGFSDRGLKQKLEKA